MTLGSRAPNYYRTPRTISVCFSPAALSCVKAGSFCRSLGSLRGKLRRLAGLGFVGEALSVGGCGSVWRSERGRTSTPCRGEAVGQHGCLENCTPSLVFSAKVYSSIWNQAPGFLSRISPLRIRVLVDPRFISSILRQGGCVG